LARDLLQGASIGLVLAAAYVLVALGLTLVFSILEIINFAHGDFVMLGAVATFYLFAEGDLPFLVVLVLVAVAAFVLGAAVEQSIFKRFRGDLLGAFVVSLGLAWILQMGATEVFGAQPRRVPEVLSGTVQLAGVRISFDRILVVAVGVAFVVALTILIGRTQLGRAMRAVAQNPDAASILGVNTSLVITLGFALGAALAAVAGVLIAPLFSVSAGMGVGFTIKAFIIIIIGGMGSLPGAVLAGTLLGLFEGIGGLYVANSALLLVEFGLVIGMLLLRPQGLLGTAE
jgi:branched-chain amino acid transport system permease protein